MKRERLDVGQRAFEDRGAGADQFGRDREEELVGEPRRPELRVDPRATLAEDGAHLTLLAQAPQRLGQVDPSLGFADHLVFLAPMWRECLDSDTYAQGPGSTVARVVDGTLSGQGPTGMAGVANTGPSSVICTVVR